MPAPKSATDSHQQVGALIADKYRVERLLGTGGMGSVIEASHTSLGHRVALKVLHPEAIGAGDALARFFREARATALLESDHVVKIHDIGTTPEGMPFLVMERLVGFDLGDLLLRIGPFPLGLALECLYQATLGVREAHAAGVIHRDLKPSNLFLARKRDGAPNIKVLDFGISKVESEDQNVRLTETRTIVGSPLYMSPEQVRDARSVSVRSDIWALGAILQELLTGEPAFRGDTLPSVCASIVSDDPRVIERDDVPPQVREICLRCLEKDASLRYQTTDELIAALEPLRAMHPAEPLSGLSVAFPERSSRDAALSRTPRPQLPEFYSQATIDESVDEVLGQTDSGVRRRGSQSTLTSARLSQTTSSPRKTSLGLWVLLGLAAVVALGSVGYFALSGQKSVETAAEASGPGAVTPPLKLTLRSEPAGALVTEGGRVLGKTPVELQLSFSDVRTRELELLLTGYLPYLLTVSESDLGQAMDVALIEQPKVDPEPKAQENVEPEQKAPPPPPVTAKSPRPRVTSAPAPKAAPQDPTDIRMSR